MILFGESVLSSVGWWARPLTNVNSNPTICDNQNVPRCSLKTSRSFPGVNHCCWMEIKYYSLTLLPWRMFTHIPWLTRINKHLVLVPLETFLNSVWSENRWFVNGRESLGRSSSHILKRFRDNFTVIILARIIWIMLNWQIPNNEKNVNCIYPLWSQRLRQFKNRRCNNHWRLA